jgi:DNA repair protein RecN (Recombination protein N)
VLAGGEQARLVGEVERLRGEEDYLRHRAAELGELAPQLGEEEALAAQRQRLAGSDKLASVLGEIVGALGEGPAGARERLAAAQRRLERSGAALDPAVAPVRDALERALIELDEVEAALAAAAAAIDADPDALERVENRLFALRDAARKHRVPIDGLPALLADTEAALAGIERGGEALAAAEAATAAARAHYRAAAERLTTARRGAAERLATAVTAELAPLKLEQARFRVALTPLAEPDWGTQGAERVTFEVATNPGQPFGALARIASGGELSRLMLALKVVLARLGEAPTLIFDEIDAGIGGATADAVGERLARLGRERQVLVVTHAPQVAARADHHLTVAKRSHGERTMVEVRTLDQTARRREIARMLAGAEITEAAQAAAASLLVSAGRS